MFSARSPVSIFHVQVLERGDFLNIISLFWWCYVSYLFIELYELHVGGSYGPAYKSGSSLTTNSKGKPSASPLSSPPEPSGAPASPFGNVNLLKGQIVVDDMIPTQTITKATSSDKEIPGKAITSSVQDKVGRKSHTGTTSTDLRSMLISLLMENQSKGISLKVSMLTELDLLLI